MIAVDTHVVVRLLVADDTAQARRARALFDHNTIWIGTTVILETELVVISTFYLTMVEDHSNFALWKLLRTLLKNDQQL